MGKGERFKVKPPPMLSLPGGKIRKESGKIKHIWGTPHVPISCFSLWMPTPQPLPRMLGEDTFSLLFPPMHGSEEGRKEGRPFGPCVEMMEEEEEEEERKGGVSLTYTTFLFGHPAEGDSTILVHENRNNIAGKLTDGPFF